MTLFEIIICVIATLGMVLCYRMGWYDGKNDSIKSAEGPCFHGDNWDDCPVCRH